MQYRTLGRSGAVVSAFALGTMTFGAEADEATSHAILDDYAEAGGTFIDTADVYSHGTSEEIVGRWLAGGSGRREAMVVATKGRFPMGDGPNDLGTSRRHLRTALDASLRRLGTDHIDLYQMHAWDPHTPIEETLRFLDDAVSAGKIGYYGFSNFLGWQLTKAVYEVKAHGWAAPVTLQPQYNLLVRGIESEVVPAALDAGWGSSRGARWPGAGSAGSTSGTSRPQATRASAKTRSAAWRPGSRATPAPRPGTSSTPSGRWHRVTAPRRRRSP